MKLPSLYKLAMPHYTTTTFTLCNVPHSVYGVCFSLYLNKTTSYLSLSHWILSVMRHEELELVLRLVWDSNWKTVGLSPSLWVQDIIWVLAGSEFHLRCVVSVLPKKRMCWPGNLCFCSISSAFLWITFLPFVSSDPTPLLSSGVT